MPPPVSAVPSAALPIAPPREPVTALSRPEPAIPENRTAFFNRDLSWLDFNHRVLNEAFDPRTPLLERLKFLAIYSSNSDEFFMKRVGLLRRKIAQKSLERSHDGLTAEQHYLAVREKLRSLTREVVEFWTTVLRPALEKENIFIRDYVELTAAQKAKADDYFHAQIFPVLTPLAVDPGHPFPFISNLSLSIGVLLKQPGTPAPDGGSVSAAGGGEHLFARIKVPQVLSRWLTFQEEGAPGPAGKKRDTYVFMPIESLIEARLEALFPGMEIVEHQHFRVTRNAEVETEIEDPEDLLEVVQEELRARRFADTVRVQIASNMSMEMRQYLMEGLEVSEDSIYEIPEPLGKTDLMAIATTVDRPDLKYLPWKPDIAPAIADPEADMFALIRQGDILVHHPYESFDSSVERFILQAVKDPRVVAIKMTLYRTSGDSPFVEALARAANSGKQVAVLVELKARFDEERNIQWARMLEEAGAHVVYGVLGLKTHTKTALVVRREDAPPGANGTAGGNALRCYVHIATGNYNSKTAQLYTDLGLFTCREDICEDVVNLFAFLTGRSLKRDYRKLLVAPLTMRTRFIEMIEREAEHARAGRPARIVAKMNALEDVEVIQALYRASQAGVKITLMVRGFCCLRPQLPGVSDNIQVMCVIGRFLEHSRIFYFQNGGSAGGGEEMFMGSGDWMNRNLSHRVEAAVPVEDPVLQARLKEIIDIMLADNRQAWDLSADGTWTQRQPAPGEPERGTHLRLMELTAEHSRKAHLGRIAKAALEIR